MDLKMLGLGGLVGGALLAVKMPDIGIPLAFGGIFLMAMAKDKVEEPQKVGTTSPEVSYNESEIRRKVSGGQILLLDSKGNVIGASGLPSDEGKRKFIGSNK